MGREFQASPDSQGSVVKLSCEHSLETEHLQKIFKNTPVRLDAQSSLKVMETVGCGNTGL